MRSFKSPRARRRLIVIATVAPVLAVAAGLTLWAAREQVTFFYSPAEAAQVRPAPGVIVRLGGLVEEGTVVREAEGHVAFSVTDGAASTRVRYQGDLPDLFREGQGVVVQGAFTPEGDFRASEVLAKHDETYMPREVAESLKRQGRWREGEVAPNS